MRIRNKGASATVRDVMGGSGVTWVCVENSLQRPRCSAAPNSHLAAASGSEALARFVVLRVTVLQVYEEYGGQKRNLRY